MLRHRPHESNMANVSLLRKLTQNTEGRMNSLQHIIISRTQFIQIYLLSKLVVQMTWGSSQENALTVLGEGFVVYQNRHAFNLECLNEINLVLVSLVGSAARLPCKR
jgi:hypothetical protein